MKKVGKVYDVAEERTALLLPVRKVQGSHLEQETTYPDWSFVVFLSPPRKMQKPCLYRRHDYSFPALTSSSFIHCSSYRFVISDPYSVVVVEFLNSFFVPVAPMLIYFCLHSHSWIIGLTCSLLLVHTIISL